MATKKQPRRANVAIENCTFNGGTQDSQARLELAQAIRANAEAARELAKNLPGAALLTISMPKAE